MSNRLLIPRKKCLWAPSRRAFLRGLVASIAATYVAKAQFNGPGFGASGFGDAAPSGGPAPYVAQAVHFDGMAALTRTALDGISDASALSFNFWFKIATSTTDQGNPEYINADTDTFKTLIAAVDDCGSSGFHNVAKNADNSSQFIVTSNSDIPSINTWHRFSGNVNSQNGTAIMMLDGSDVLNNVSPSGDPFDLILTRKFGFPDSIDNAPLIVADFADVWYGPGQEINFSNPSVDVLFAVDNKPVNLSAAIIAFGNPAVLLSGDSTGFIVNQGTGGALTLTGSVTNAMTSPSD